MASINKQSLREEFDTLKAHFKDLSANGKVGEESRALIQAMLMLFEVLMVVFMERRTTKGNRNSSLPSSQTPKSDESATQPGSKGKGKSQKDLLSGNTRTVESSQLSPVSQCETCGEDLRKAPCLKHERRTKIDIIFEKVVQHVDAEIKQCPHCKAQTKGRFPQDMPGPLQYGSGIKGYILNLLIGQMIPLKRLQQTIKTLIGKAISEATILKYMMQLHRSLEDWEHASIVKLLNMPAIHADETSLRVDKKNHWIHVYSGGDITLKFLHPKRGREAIEAIGVIPCYEGVVIHDCWASYLAYDQCGHGLCGSHLLRELTFIVESNGFRWAKNVKRLLQETCHKISKRERKKLTESEFKSLRKRYRNILTRGKKELPPIPPKPSGKRGRVAKSDAHNLWERLKKHEAAVLRFAEKSEVSFTNNRAERDLRMSKVKQKISGCFRTRTYAEAFCRISSYLQTMANQGYNSLVAIQMALSGQIYLDTGE